MLPKASIISKELNLALLAISFFTRIPVNINADVDEQMLNKASRYFALVGVLIGTCSALIFCLAEQLFPTAISLLFAMAAGILLTGAFHEDGWADVWDGFGGGWTVENKLAIMKDSRLGTYGACALFFILFVKFQALLFLVESINFDNISVFAIFILAHCLSRVLATSLIFDMPYVSEDANAKVKPLAQQLSVNGLLILLATGLVALLIFLPFGAVLQLLLVLIAARWLIKLWFIKQLGGYTGDCLGAAQQLSEVIVYLSLLVLLPEVL